MTNYSQLELRVLLLFSVQVNDIFLNKIGSLIKITAIIEKVKL